MGTRLDARDPENCESRRVVPKELKDKARRGKGARRENPVLIAGRMCKLLDRILNPGGKVFVINRVGLRSDDNQRIGQRHWIEMYTVFACFPPIVTCTASIPDPASEGGSSTPI